MPDRDTTGRDARSGEFEHPGHKVFVYPKGDAVVLEAVTDTMPPHRMTFVISTDEAEEIAATLMGAVIAVEATNG
jgi:hypothetical protein